MKFAIAVVFGVFTIVQAHAGMGGASSLNCFESLFKDVRVDIAVGTDRQSPSSVLISERIPRTQNYRELAAFDAPTKALAIETHRSQIAWQFRKNGWFVEVTTSREHPPVRFEGEAKKYWQGEGVLVAPNGERTELSCLIKLD